MLVAPTESQPPTSSTSNLAMAPPHYRDVTTWHRWAAQQQNKSHAYLLEPVATAPLLTALSARESDAPRPTEQELPVSAARCPCHSV